MTTIRLLRNLRDSLRNNPIIVYNAPWRRGWWRLAVALFLIFVPPLALWFGMHGVLGVAADFLFDRTIPIRAGGVIMAPPKSQPTSATPESFTVMSLFLTVASVPVAACLFWLLARNYQQNKAALTDLVLTPLSRREIVIGSLFWGVAGCVLLAIVWALLLLIIKSYFLQVPISDDDPNIGFLRSIRFIGMVALPITIITCFACRIIASPDQKRSAFWTRSIVAISLALILLRIIDDAMQTLLPSADLKGAYEFHTGRWSILRSDWNPSLVMAFGFSPLQLDRRSLGASSFLSEHLFIALFSLYPLMLTITAGVSSYLCLARTLPDRYFRAIDPEAAIAKDWKYREFLFKHSKLPSKKSIEESLRLYVGLNIELFLFALISNLVLFNIYVYALMERIMQNPMVIFIVFSTIPILTLGLLFGYRQLKGADRIPVIASQITRSVRVLSIGYHSATILSFLVLPVLLDGSPLRMIQNPLPIFIIASAIAMGHLGMTLLIPRRGRSRALLLVLAFSSFFLMLGGLVSLDGATLIVSVICYAMCGIAITAVLFGLLDYLIQRIHDSEVDDHAPGQLSTEEPAGAEKAIQMLLSTK